MLDGAPIVAIAVGLAKASSNRKTGGMLQTYILRSDVDPVRAIKQLKDSSICGDCVHRGSQGKGRTCYVQVGQGPLGVYRAFKRGRYPEIPNSEIKTLADAGMGRLVRLGTYGDPAAVPAGIWRSILFGAKGHTGYTHQWKRAPDLKGLCMASVDSEIQALWARSLGWRTFRVALPHHDARIAGEAICPASAEAGRKLTCERCLACGGADGRKGSIVIAAHGGTAVMSAVRKLSAIPITLEAE